MGAAVGRLHDAWPAPGADVNAPLRRAIAAVARHQSGKLARLLVVDRVLHLALRRRQGLRIALRTGLPQGLLGALRRDEAGAAKNHNRVFDAQLLLLQVGLEHFELHAHAAGLAAQQKLRVGKGQSVGVGL